jgi:hypothetical protein
MVAFNSTRRQSAAAAAQYSPVEALLAGERGGPLESAMHAGASHRSPRNVAVRKDRFGEILDVRIGRWRVVAPAETRRIAEVRELACGRVALRIERFADSGSRATSEIWQLYDLEGRLEAALQTTLDGKFAMLTNYRMRKACRLAADGNGTLKPVEAWRI